MRNQLIYIKIIDWRKVWSRAYCDGPFGGCTGFCRHEKLAINREIERQLRNYFTARVIE